MVGATLERLYARLGARYLLLLFGVAALSIVGLTLVAAALAIPYAGTSASQYLDVLLVAVPVMTVVAAAAELTVAHHLAPLLRWLRGPRGTDGAIEAWHAAAVGIARAITVSAIVVAIGALPAELYGAERAGVGGGATGMVATVFGITWIIASGGMLHFFCWEQALRPVVVDIARHLPASFTPRRRAVPLGRKLLLLLPLMNALNGMITAGVATDSLGPAGKIALGVATGIVVSLTIGLALTLLLRRSLTLPIGDLLSAIEAVERGDLSTRIPRASADELGELVRNFNAMVEGLEDRELLRDRNAELDSALETSLREVTHQAAELRESRARVVSAADAARRQVERDLHDGAQQHLVLLGLKLGLAERLVEKDPAAATAMHHELREDLDRALSELRDLAHGIYPAVLENEGLPGALREAAQRSAFAPEVECDAVGRYAPVVEAAVYFCCLEALQNAWKHAGEAAQVRVTLTQANGTLAFRVSDDGRGFDASAAVASAGIQNMADRVGALGGSLDVKSAPGEGTRIAGTVPVETCPT